MGRPSRPWFRFYVEAVHDRKMRRLSPTQRWLWVAILAAARQSPVPGELFVAVDVPMTLDELADFAGVKRREVDVALVEMEALGMVDTNGSVSVCNWKERQFESDNVTARTAKHRSQERSNPVPGNAPDTDTDTETERERERPPKRQRGTRLPEDWEPSEATKDWVRREYPAHAKRKVIEAFRDHYLSKPDTRLDWERAFKNWVRKQDEFHPASADRGPSRTHL